MAMEAATLSVLISNTADPDPVTNTSVNPARSTGPALFVGGWALSQLWMFWLAPIVGAAAAGLTYRMVLEGIAMNLLLQEMRRTDCRRLESLSPWESFDFYF